MTCLNFVRSTPVCQRSTRQQLNKLTAFIDGSTVYGSSKEHESQLRTFDGGQLVINIITKQPPTMEQLNLRPNQKLVRPETQKHFVAGDERVNEHPFLTAMHTIFLKEHNRIAKELRSHLPHFLRYIPSNIDLDDLFYQETRRIVVAEIQNIVYGEYLPSILGEKFMNKYSLIVTETSDYDPDVNPTIFNEFTTAAFRFGHSMINSKFMVGSSQKRPVWWKLRDIFDGQKVRGNKMPIEQMLEGLISQAPQKCDAYFSSEVIDHLFQKNNERQDFGLDLLAINIQRGRDHGIPSYNAFRKHCGLKPLTSWREKPSELDEAIWLNLKKVYEKVEDIDLYIGGVSERNVYQGSVGPVFACIIGEQFRRLKYGDRYFYSHSNKNGGKGLGEIARKYVTKRRLGDLICDNTNLKGTQRWVTNQPNDNNNPFEYCSEKSSLNLAEIAKEISSELNDPSVVSFCQDIGCDQ